MYVSCNGLCMQLCCGRHCKLYDGGKRASCSLQCQLQQSGMHRPSQLTRKHALATAIQTFRAHAHYPNLQFPLQLSNVHGMSEKHWGPPTCFCTHFTKGCNRVSQRHLTKALCSLPLQRSNTTSVWNCCRACWSLMLGQNSEEGQCVWLM